MPTVSIVAPCYNAEMFVGRTIESVRQQTLSDWEHIVVDDGSTDASAAAFHPYLLEESRLKLVSQSNNGVCHARNAGYNAASGDSESLLFLDVDDCLEPGMLETLVEYLNENPEVGLVHCEYTLIDGHDAPLNPPSFQCHRYTPRRGWVNKLPADHVETPSSGWDEQFGQPCEDTDLFLHMALLSQVHFLSKPLVRYRRHEAQSTEDVPRYDRQKLKLHQKWLNDIQLTDKQEKDVTAAWKFHEGRVRPYLFLTWGVDHFQHGRWIKGAKSWLRAVKQSIRCVKSSKRTGPIPEVCARSRR